jgi:hypothetical protein
MKKLTMVVGLECKRHNMRSSMGKWGEIERVGWKGSKCGTY